MVLDQESMKTVLSGDEEEMFRSFTDAMEIDRVHQVSNGIRYREDGPFRFRDTIKLN